MVKQVVSMDWAEAVLYTPTACPTDSDGLSSDPAISDGPSGQSVGSPSESVGHDWIPLLVQPKSSESPLKPLKSKKWLDWLEFVIKQWKGKEIPQGVIQFELRIWTLARCHVTQSILIKQVR